MLENFLSITRSHVTVLGIWVTLSTSAYTQESPEFVEFEKRLEQAQKEELSKIAQLFDKYAAAAVKVQDEFQKKGDLVNAVKVREEVSKAKEQRILGIVEIPNMEKLRNIMVVELDKIRLAEIVRASAARETLIELLSAREKALTKDGKLD